MRFAQVSEIWLARLTVRVPKVLDRVKISDGENNCVLWTFADEDGVIIASGCIPSSEWKELRDNVISSFPKHVTTSVLTDYIVILGELVS